MSQQAQIVSSGSEGFSHPQQLLLSSTLSRNPTANKASCLSPIGSLVRKNLFISTNIDVSLMLPRLHWIVSWGTVRRNKLICWGYICQDFLAREFVKVIVKRMEPGVRIVLLRGCIG